MALNTIIEEGYFTEKAEIKVTALCDIDADHLAKYNQQFDVPNIFTDYHDLIACEDVNTIYIVTPTKFHAEIYYAAAEAKKNIFLEKPITDPPSEIANMIETRDNAGIITQVGLCLRYSPIFWYVKKLIDDPENKERWGRLQNVIFRDSQDKPYTGHGNHPSVWRKDPEQAFHGCLFEHSIHDVDIMQYWCGDITEVYGKVKFFANIPEIEDSVCACFELENGASAHLTSMWHNFSQDQRDIELYFENTYINLIFEGIGGFLTILEKDRGKETMKFSDADKIFRDAFGWGDHPPIWLADYGYEDIAFLNSLIEGIPASPSLEDAKRAHVVVDACYHSSKHNEVVKLVEQ
jgi:predicted dehydrogenase